MARIRSIHPGLFTDEAFMSVTASARLLFIGLWCEADDGGVFEWKAITLKARLFPADAVDTAALLQELAGQDMIRQFSIGGRLYGAIRNFCRYQRPKAPKIVHPATDEVMGYLARDGSGIEGPMNHPKDVTAADRKRRERERKRDASGECHASAVTHSEVATEYHDEFPKNGEVSRQMEGVGCLSEGNISTHPAAQSASKRQAEPDAVLDEFSRIFWPAYPRKDAKAKAILAFRKARKRVDLETIMEGLRRYNAVSRDPQFVCHATSWLNGERWADQPAPQIFQPTPNQLPFASNRQEPRNGNRIIDHLRNIGARLEDIDSGCIPPARSSFAN